MTRGYRPLTLSIIWQLWIFGWQLMWPFRWQLMWPFRFVAVTVCGRSGLGRSGLWPFRFVAVPVCGLFGLWPFRSVAVPVCGRFGLWPFRFVAVMTCFRLDDSVVPNRRQPIYMKLWRTGSVTHIWHIWFTHAYHILICDRVTNTRACFHYVKANIWNLQDITWGLTWSFSSRPTREHEVVIVDWWLFRCIAQNIEDRCIRWQRFHSNAIALKVCSL